MGDVWAPRRVRLKRRVHPGDSTIHVYESTSSGFLARLGTELVTVGGSGEVWSISPSATQNHHADGFLSEVTIRVVMNGVDHTGVAQHIVTKEASPRGEIEASWDIYTKSPSTWTPNLQSTNPVPFSRLENSSGSFHPFFAGYMGRTEDSQAPNGFHQLRLVGRGGYTMAQWNGYKVSKLWAPTTAGRQVCIDALLDWAPQISSTTEHIIDGGLQIGQQLEGIGKTPLELWEFVQKRGDASGPLDWYVRTDSDGGIKFWLLIRGRQPVVTIPISSLKAPVTFVQDVQYVRNSVTIKWRDGFVTEPSGVVGGGTAAGNWKFFDYSTRIDNHDLALQVAQAYIREWGTLVALSDGQIVVEHPKPIYVNGVPFPPHLVKAGWQVQFTGWAGGFSLPIAQIKGLEANHSAHELSLQTGPLVEDDLAFAEQWMGKESKILGNATSGLIPQNITPPENMAQAVTSTAVAMGADGYLGFRRLAPDADISPPIYMIDAGYEADDITPKVITSGRKYPLLELPLGCRVLGFSLNGNDGDKTDPGPGTIGIKISLGHKEDKPDQGAEVVTVTMAGEVENKVDLTQPSGTPVAGNIFTAIAGDYLSFEVLEDPVVDLMNNVAITVILQRTKGSIKGTLTGAPVILSGQMTRDVDTGIINFTVHTDRPGLVQIEYGKDTAYGSWSGIAEITTETVIIPVRPITSPFHWRVHARDAQNHQSVGADQTG